MHHSADQPPPASQWALWVNKFRCAGRGVRIGMHGQASFAVHLVIAVAVIALAAVLRLQCWQWCVLLLCIGSVLAMELLNTAIERLVRALHPQRDPQIGELLDIAAGAVLVTAIAAATCGCLVFLPPLMRYL